MISVSEEGALSDTGSGRMFLLVPQLAGGGGQAAWMDTVMTGSIHLWLFRRTSILGILGSLSVDRERPQG
jgi:hypothetical protein